MEYCYSSGWSGVPVYLDDNKDVRTTEAVMIKTWLRHFLQHKLTLMSFISLPMYHTYISIIKKPDQQIKEFLNYADALKFLNEGQFSKGSMAPKIQACLIFYKEGGKEKV